MHVYRPIVMIQLCFHNKIFRLILFNLPHSRALSPKHKPLCCLARDIFTRSSPRLRHLPPASFRRQWTLGSDDNELAARTAEDAPFSTFFPIVSQVAVRCDAGTENRSRCPNRQNSTPLTTSSFVPGVRSSSTCAVPIKRRELLEVPQHINKAFFHCHFFLLFSLLPVLPVI